MELEIHVRICMASSFGLSPFMMSKWHKLENDMPDVR